MSFQIACTDDGILLIIVLLILIKYMFKNIEGGIYPTILKNMALIYMYI